MRCSPTVPGVPRLIHLNGLPGIGKSTLAALYAERHPGTLNLDIDRLHHLVGGWEELTEGVLLVLRPIALAMASAHLAGGRDVVLPQCLVTLPEISAFEEVARGRQADYREIMLLDDRRRAIARYTSRAEHDPDPWIQHQRRQVARDGGESALGLLYDGLLEIAGARPSTVVVRSEPGKTEETYSAVVEASGGRPRWPRGSGSPGGATA